MSMQLTPPEKIIIERMIYQDNIFASIACHLDRSASTVAREVLHLNTDDVVLSPKLIKH